MVEVGPQTIKLQVYIQSINDMTTPPSFSLHWENIGSITSRCLGKYHLIFSLFLHYVSHPTCLLNQECPHHSVWISVCFCSSSCLLVSSWKTRVLPAKEKGQQNNGVILFHEHLVKCSEILSAN